MQGKDSPKKVQPPTLMNLPPSQLSQKEGSYNYSLCDSVDYQQSELGKSAGPVFTQEQVNLLLQKQKVELL